VKSDALPVKYSEDGLVFSDGTEMKADVILFTTGFAQSLQGNVATILGEEVAARAGRLFGLDDEGEIYGAFKPTGRRFSFSCTSPSRHIC
jgi:hypothetical protein